MATTSRLLTLLSLLQARRDWPGSVLASRLEVSDRTVRRDIDRLRDMGYRIGSTMGPDGGYRLEAGTDMPPLLFDDDQALAVAIALRAAPALGAGIGEAAVRALATMRQVLPSRLRHRLDAVEVTTVGRAGEAPTPAVPLDVLLTLAQAVRDRMTVRFDYLPRGEGDAQARRAEPHHLVASQGRWYLLGWDLDREDWRLYSADRVRPRMPSGAPFAARTVPGGDVDAFVSARFKGSDVNEWPCRGTVLLHAPARDVLPFAGDGTVTAVDDDRCILEVGSWSWGALAASFGRFEVAMEVVEPAELVEAFAVQAGRFVVASRRNWISLRDGSRSKSNSQATALCARAFFSVEKVGVDLYCGVCVANLHSDPIFDHQTHQSISVDEHNTGCDIVCIRDGARREG